MVVECPLVVVLPVCLIQDIFNLDEYYLQDNPVCLPHLIRPQILVRCIATSSTFQLHQQAASVICLHRVCHRQTVQDYYSILPGKMYIFFVCPQIALATYRVDFILKIHKFYKGYSRLEDINTDKIKVMFLHSGPQIALCI